MVTSANNLEMQIQQLELPRKRALLRVFRRAASDAYMPPVRTRLQFVKECLVIPEGKHGGSPWLPQYQPFAYHLLDQMDRCGKRRFAVTGCVQSGKTLIAVVANVCWHLFERREPVGFCLPELTMGEKKWREEIEPVIRSSPWMSQFLPKSGSGSKGGFKNVMRFTNGTRIEFMGATGNDARRSSSTLKVMFKSEVDRFDVASAASREAAAAMTVEDRTDSFGDDAFIYEECTMTTVNGRINKQFLAGTGTELYVPCVHCGAYVLPVRQDLVGIEGCEDIEQARESGCFICPECKEIWSEQDRRVMQDRSIPVHRGQTVKLRKDKSPVIEGDEPRTDTFSFRWNAFQNRFWTTRRLAGKEWTALYSDDADDEDKQAKQKRWAEPAKADKLDLTKLTMRELRNSEITLGLKRVPVGAKWLTSALDVGAHFLHYVVRSWSVDEQGRLTGHMLDMGKLDVFSADLGLQDAVIDALRRYRDEILMPGYFDADGSKYVAGWTLIDAGWKERWVWSFVLECVQMGIETIIPIVGRGQSDPQKPGTYRHPESVDNKKVFWIGDECHLRKSSRYADAFVEAGCTHPPLYVMANSDEFKSFVREGYKAPNDANGSLTTFAPVSREERDMIQQFRDETRAEKERQKYIEGRGVVSYWENIWRQKNHFGDADYYNVPAAQLCGAPVTVRLRNKPQSPVPEAESKHITMPDGRPYMAVQ